MKLYFHSSVIYWLLSSLTALGQAPTITRGPYLQVVTPTSVTVRWRTNQSTDSRVTFGTRAGQFNQQASVAQLTTEHIVTLTGLQPATKYYYTIGSTAAVLSGDSTQNVRTAPVAGSTAPIRFWALGDFGSATPNQFAVRDQIARFTAGHRPDIWLWLGDNAYNAGTDAEFGQKVFAVYPDFFKNIPVWPAPGNHDYGDNICAMDIDYYKIFSVPVKGEAGGVPSETASYYSYDYGNVHFISLDSYGTQGSQSRLYDTTGTQVQWLKRDLTANKRPWTVVYFHHPPHTKGSHNSDTEDELVRLRQNLTPILERFGVDLVLNGHSHVYERSYRLRNHTGLANTFQKRTNTTDTTTFRYDGSANSCPVVSQGVGTVYAVAGSGGQLGGQAAGYPHPAMIYSNTSLGGSLVVDVTDNRMDGQWVAADGSVPDRFTIIKSVNKTSALTAEFADTLQLNASWPGEYRWSNGQTNRSIRYVAATSGQFSVKVTDPQQCLTDQFQVNVQARPKLTAQTPTGSVCASSTISVTALPENTTKAAGWQYDVLLSDASGNFTPERLVGSGALSQLKATLPANLPAGTGYRLQVRPRGITYADVASSGAFTVSALPTATLTGSATVLQGQPASLTLSFTGDGPWRGSLSDGTSFSATTTPTAVTVLAKQTATYSITALENSCGKGTGSGQASVTILLPTEAEEFAGGRLSIYPNPAHDVVQIDLSTTQKQEVRLFLRDSQGKSVFQKQFGLTTHVTESIPMPTSAGTYLLTVQVGQQTLTRKVVRQ
ncbi:metallophosphoesterase [Spirosoma soli]|uniref:Metallophosphoesterase n=1 Tax=Spirosoma soli TaxID=1770529 RepID=A0ABW5M0M2_9BACT